MTTGVPLEIDAATYSAFGDARLVVELTGHWVASGREVDRSRSARLLLDVGGRPHAFEEMPARAYGDLVATAAYSASFVVPAAAEAALAGAMLCLGGEQRVRVPSAMWVTNVPAEQRERTRSGVRPGQREPMLAALRSELTERAGEEARLRRTVGELRAQLKARDRGQERVEATQEQLRLAVETLREGLDAEMRRRSELESALAAARSAVEEIERELAEREADLATALVSRDSAAAEVNELRHELEGVLADSGRAGAGEGEEEVAEAEALLAEARRLTDRLLAPSEAVGIAAEHD